MKFVASYNTTSNRTRIVKTPGGELRILHIKKRGTAPKCGDCGTKLPGVSSTTPSRIGILCNEATKQRGRNGLESCYRIAKPDTTPAQSTI